MYVNPGFDIREHKKELRDNFKRLRAKMPPQLKTLRDDSICARFVSTMAYQKADTLLIYVSTAIEVDTYGIITRALSDGKTVAVPRCIDGTRDMDFYIISSFDQLEKGTFSVMEPIPEKCEKLTRFSGALCVVPALSYDMSGYRLGYGGGYYDRFISAHPDMICVGICYCCCTVQELVRGRFDRAVNMLITEKYVRKNRRC